jgi:hypothetical protein
MIEPVPPDSAADDYQRMLSHKARFCTVIVMDR